MVSKRLAADPVPGGDGEHCVSEIAQHLGIAARYDQRVLARRHRNVDLHAAPSGLPPSVS